MSDILGQSIISQELIKENPYASLGSGRQTSRKFRNRLENAPLDMEIQLENAFRLFSENDQDLTSALPAAAYASLQSININMVGWVRFRNGGGNLPPSSQQLLVNFIQDIDNYKKAVISLLPKQEGKKIVVPDTNVFVEFPLPRDYKKMIGNDFEVYIAPTLIKELDELKIRKITDSFRKKVTKAIRIVNGWTEQGSIVQGVNVDGIVVKAIAVEPSFNHTSMRLDPQNEDDRLIASSLELARDHPSKEVVILSRDINLKSKVTLAGISIVGI